MTRYRQSPNWVEVLALGVMVLAIVVATLL